MLSEEDIKTGIATLTRQFGHGLDPAVLQSVLELHGGDVKATTEFLQAQAGDFVDQGREKKESLPDGYMTRPSGWSQPKGIVKTLKAEEKIAESMKTLFLSDSAFLDHFNAQKTSFALYQSVMLLLITRGVELTSNTRSRVLAACWGRGDHKLSNYLLTRDDLIGLPEVLRAVKILDAPRKIRSIEKKIARLTSQGTAKPKTLKKLKAKINDIRCEVPKGFACSGVSGSLCRKIKKWAQAVPKGDLEFFALQMPKEPWQELADICHLKPANFKLPWFLPFVFGAEPPKDSLLGSGAKITKESVTKLCKQFNLPYSYVRRQVDTLSDEAKEIISRYERVDAVFWYYEELQCPGVDAVILERLKKGEAPKFSYGKLMERLLVFKAAKAPFLDLLIPIAQKRLEQIKIPLEPPVVVYGDASYSMDVAIRTSTIIGSLLTALTAADLAFFNVEVVAPELIPRTIPEILRVATTTKADGMTAPACCLEDFYKKKKVIKFFIMVTDEIENIKSGTHYFAQLYYKYYTEVYPAKIIFVSFLEDPNQKGRMVRALENLGIVPMQFRLDAKRPDLTKLDTLLGMLSAETDFFTSKALEVAEKSSKLTFEEVLKEMNAPIVLKAEKAEPAGKGKYDEDDFEMTDVMEKNLPEEFVCPITSEIMKDPVVAQDGHTYEREALMEWFNKSSTSPLTGKELEVKMVFPNFSIKSRISEWLLKMRNLAKIGLKADEKEKSDAAPAKKEEPTAAGETKKSEA